MVDKVRPLKIEEATNGTQVNPFPTEADPTADYLSAKGIAFEQNDNRLIDLTGGGEIQFTDVNGTVALSNVGSSFAVSAVSSNVTLSNKTIHLVDTSAARTLTLPSPSSGLQLIIKDATGQAEANNITIARAGSEQIDGIAASLTISSNYSSTTLVSNGFHWYII